MEGDLSLASHTSSRINRIAGGHHSIKVLKKHAAKIPSARQVARYPETEAGEALKDTCCLDKRIIPVAFPEGGDNDSP
jgi:hypothetical protein